MAGFAGVTLNRTHSVTSPVHCLYHFSLNRVSKAIKDPINIHIFFSVVFSCFSDFKYLFTLTPYFFINIYFLSSDLHDYLI